MEEIHRIVIPPDEIDEDDEKDAMIEERERNRRSHVVRGRFTATQ